MGFPIITNEIQKDFENEKTSGYIPMTCGIHGRACRKMNRPEGANSAHCQSCDLANFAKASNAVKKFYGEES